MRYSENIFLKLRKIFLDSFHMKKRLLAAVAFLVCFSLQAQQSIVNFGEVSKEDLAQKIYLKDSSAEAVMLFDYGHYSYSFTESVPHVIYTFHRKVKILKKSGFRWATINIPYHVETDVNRTEAVVDIKAATYNLENGNRKVTDVVKSSIFDEKTSATQREKKMVFPQVKEGSIIEYTYTIDSPLWYFLRTWDFQQDIPVVWSELRATIPAYFDYKITSFGYNQFAVNEVKEGKERFLPHVNDLGQDIKDPFLDYRFAMQDLSSIKEDDYMTTIQDYRSSIDFELARTVFPSTGEHVYSITYKDLTKTLLEDDNYGTALKRFGKSAEKIMENLPQVAGKDTLARIKNLYDHVRKTVKWNDENRLFTKNKLEQVYEKQLGNASGVNLILVGLLREMGFDANPVILSTRSHGKVLTDIALMDRFNYTVAHIMFRGKDFLLDATDQYIKPNMLPKKCLNERGWLISKNPRWVSLMPIEKKQTSTLLSFTIENDQVLKGKLSEFYGGYAATDILTEVSKSGEVKYIEKFKNEHLNAENQQVSYKSTENNDVQIECEMSVNEAYSVAGNRIFLQPLLWKKQKENPFKQTERNYPLDLAYRIQETVTAKYTIPKNYSVETVPANKILSLPDGKGKFVYMIKNENGVIDILNQIILAKPIFSPDEYYDLREFFNQIIAKQNEQIVLKKN
jgi:hypothetical protein